MSIVALSASASTSGERSFSNPPARNPLPRVAEDIAAVHACTDKLEQGLKNLSVKLDSANKIAISASQDTNKSMLYLSGAAAFISAGLFIYLFRQKPR
ncbi:MAG TPA: hypothetical protein VGM34_01850 [Chlamydiales bacterium]|jgi:hypothetical protein